MLSFICFLLGVVFCYGVGVVRQEVAIQNIARAAALQFSIDLAAEADARRIFTPPIPTASPSDAATRAYEIAKKEAALQVPDETVYLLVSQETSRPIFGAAPQLIDNEPVAVRYWGKN